MATTAIAARMTIKATGTDCVFFSAAAGVAGAGFFSAGAPPAAPSEPAPAWNSRVYSLGPAAKVGCGGALSKTFFFEKIPVAAPKSVARAPADCGFAEAFQPLEL